MSISVLGGGAWGTALASSLAVHKDNVKLWARDAAAVNEINSSHRNKKYLGDIALSPKLVATPNLDEACAAKTILCVTPAQSFASMSEAIKPHVGADTQLVLCAKGIDQKSGKMLHQIARDDFGDARISALSGPSFASDVARGLPTAVSLGASDLARAQALAERLSGPWFRIYASADITGVELGGALKNVLALAVGAARGLGLGASAEAALTARGFAELNRLAVPMGARPETLAGLSGLGDLILTCSSPQSRNFAYGVALANGDDLSNMPLAEGVHTARMALVLAKSHGVEVPIIAVIAQVLDGLVTVREAVSLLLDRPLRSEG